MVIMELLKCSSDVTGSKFRGEDGDEEKAVRGSGWFGGVSA